MLLPLAFQTFSLLMWFFILQIFFFCLFLISSISCVRHQLTNLLQPCRQCALCASPILPTIKSGHFHWVAAIAMPRSRSPSSFVMTALQINGLSILTTVKHHVSGPIFFIGCITSLGAINIPTLLWSCQSFKNKFPSTSGSVSLPTSSRSQAATRDCYSCSCLPRRGSQAGC